MEYATVSDTQIADFGKRVVLRTLEQANTNISRLRRAKYDPDLSDQFAQGELSGLDKALREIEALQKRMADEL